MGPLQHNGFLITLPQPLMVVVEDTGWWQGRDGSTVNEPYRTGMDRDHCLEDYQALLLLAQRLRMRIQISMVLCEWDRSDLLRHVPTATWMGRDWRNPCRMEESLDEAADFLRAGSSHLEIGLHGVGHEFWQAGKMERTEFHDPAGIMRPPELIRQHLDAFAAIMDENGLGPFPRSFVPPALQHSFGNGDQSFQAILRDYGVRYVTTIFSRARQYTPPLHEKITWENDVLLIERHPALTPWNVQAATPSLPPVGPVVSLHWKNLLHSDPQRNEEVIAPWGDFLTACCREFNRMAAPDTAACWSQFAYHSLATLRPQDEGVEIDVSQVPNLSGIAPEFFLKIRDEQNRAWQIRNGRMEIIEQDGPVSLARIEFFSRNRPIYLTPWSSRASL
jgi:hypothetical protein